MPNQRDPDKRQLNIWRKESEMLELKLLAKNHDCSMSELIEILIKYFKKMTKKQQSDFLRQSSK
jgi:hypothetical protein